MDADSWAGALTHARGGSPIKKFRCEFDVDNVVRVLDLSNREWYTIKPFRAVGADATSQRPAASAAVEAPAPTPVAAPPPAAEPAVTTLPPAAELTPAPSAVAEAAIVTPPLVAEPAAPVEAASGPVAPPPPAPAEAPEAPASVVVEEAAPSVAPAVAGQNTLFGVPPPRAEESRLVAVAESSGPYAAVEPPVQPTLLFERDQDPGTTNPLTYRERVFSVPADTTPQQAEQVARHAFAALRRALATRPRGRYVVVAVFDHAFTSRPLRPALVELRWKDWRGDVEVTFPPAQPAGLNGAASAVATSSAIVTPPEVTHPPPETPVSAADASGSVDASVVVAVAAVAAAPEPAPAAPEPVVEATTVVVAAAVEAPPTETHAVVAETVVAKPEATVVVPEPAVVVAPEPTPPAPEPVSTPVVVAPAPVAEPAVVVAPEPTPPEPAPTPVVVAEPAPTPAPEPAVVVAPEPAPAVVVAPEPAPAVVVAPEPAPAVVVAPEPAPAVVAAQEPAPPTATEPAVVVTPEPVPTVVAATEPAPPAAAEPPTAPVAPAVAEAPAKPAPTETSSRPKPALAKRLRGKDLLSELFDSLMVLSHMQHADEAAAFIAKLMHDSIHADVSAVSLYDIDKDEFVVVASNGAEGLNGRREKATRGAPGQMVRRRHGVMIPKCEADDAIVTAAVGGGALFAPAYHRDRLFAMVRLHREGGSHAFETDELDAVSYVAGQLGEFLATHSKRVGAAEFADESRRAGAAPRRSVPPTKR